jgi:hypothetical protein
MARTGQNTVQSMDGFNDWLMPADMPAGMEPLPID